MNIQEKQRYNKYDHIKYHISYNTQSKKVGDCAHGKRTRFYL